MTAPDPEIFEIFREEAAERLDRMVETLLALEAGSAAPDAVDSLFRDAHSIKGSAGMVGIEEARAIAHTIEDVLEEARENGVFPKELSDPLLRATDALRRVIGGEVGLADTAVKDVSATGVQAGTGPETPDPAPAAVPRGTDPRPLKISAEKVDRLLNAVGETVLHARRVEHLIGNGTPAERDDERVDEELGHGEVLLDELQDAVIQMRTLPLSSITGPFPRAVRDLAVAHGKQVELDITGAETQLDRVILDGVSESITHLLRNAVAHGIESAAERKAADKPALSAIKLRAEQRGSLVAIAVADDGRGVAPELLAKADDGHALADVLSEAGFSTAEEITEVSGRGVGLDAVKSHVESLGGSLEVESEPGRGTAVTMLLPLTLALLRVLLLERGGQIFGVPLTSVEEAITVTDKMSLGGQESIELRQQSIALADLAQIIGAAAPPLPQQPQAVILASSGRRVAAVCDRIVEEDEVVVKSLGPLLHDVAGYLGGAIMGDGRIALILDPAFLTKLQPRGASAAATAEVEEVASKVLVVDDQFTVRELQRSILEAAGYRVETARDGREALTMVTDEADIELVVTDVQMPEMDGIALLRAIRDDPQHNSLPIVVVTALGGEEDRRRGAEAGADAYIVKEEFDQRALLETVNRLLTG
ncbi:MAG: two-component system, chemotaxis family, sensor kinase CheA [Solirubrobacteraceae bacterium]|nr:two-component system, chemotaxis family, sensor kinase CheA [Solirubrobacteraceae bacterium]